MSSQCAIEITSLVKGFPPRRQVNKPRVREQAPQDDARAVGGMREVIVERPKEAGQSW